MMTRELVRVRIADSGGTLQDMSSLLGVDWLVGVEIDHDIDQMAATATITLRREAKDSGGTTRSLSPLISTYLAANRAIEIDYEVLTNLATTPGTWTPLFRGHIDDAQFGGDEATITVPCRDKAGRLHDVWIEDIVERGNDGTPTAQATVMQTILDAELGSKAPDLSVTGNPDFGIVAYDQQRESLASALEAHRDLIGWDLRYRYDPSTEEFLLTYYEPDSTKTTPDHTFDADDYFALTEVEVQTSRIRNVVIVEGTLANGNTYEVEVEDVYSIADLENDDDTGRRLLYVDAQNDPLLNTTGALDNLASAILRDTSQPPLTHVAEQRFSPELELGDLLRYTANDVHYDSDQDVAVVGITHRITGTERTTVVRARGKPAGGSLRWVGRSQTSKRRQRDRDSDPPSVPILGIVSAEFDTDDLTATASGTSKVRSWRVVGSLGTEIADATLEAATPIDGSRLDPADIGTLAADATPGQIGYVAAIPYSGTGGNGEAGPRLDASAVYGVDAADVGGEFDADRLIESSQRFGFSGTWTASSNSVSWTAGTLYLADGTTYSITTDGTGVLTVGGSATYVYWDPSVSETELQATTSFATVNASSRNLILAVAWRPSGGAGTSVVPVVGQLALDGQALYPASVDTNQITANAITAVKISVAELAAISVDTGTLTTFDFEGTFAKFGPSTFAAAIQSGQFRLEDLDAPTLWGRLYVAGGGPDVFLAANGANRDLNLLTADTGTINIASNGLGAVSFFGATGSGPPDYTTSNVTTRRTIDADSINLAELADFCATMAEDLQTFGLFE